MILLSLSLLVGCDLFSLKEYEESTEPFVVQVFFSQTCPHCKQLRENLIPLLEEEFAGQITIEEYDIDDEASIELYDSYIGLYDDEEGVWDLEGKLDGVSEDIASYERYIPFVVVGDMYAFMGYTEELLNAYVQDVHLARQQRKLATGDVSNGRWYFKEEKESD